MGMPTGFVNRLASVYGVSDRTLRENSNSVVRSGVGTMDTSPRSRFSMPPVSGLAAGVSPLPLSTKICLPSRLNTAPVGYQPVGMKPSTKLRPPLLTSTTATALMSAFATSS